MKVTTGRMSPDFNDPIVVFIIGFRINSWLRVNKWLPIARSMRPMIDELYANPESGFLSTEFAFKTLREVILVQYWRDFDSLERYARARDEKHWPVWTAFNRNVGNDGTVGIYHETYSVDRNNYEAIYIGMPPTGMGKFAPLVPSTGSRNEARTRMSSD